MGQNVADDIRIRLVGQLGNLQPTHALHRDFELKACAKRHAVTGDQDVAFRLRKTDFRHAADAIAPHLTPLFSIVNLLTIDSKEVTDAI